MQRKPVGGAALADRGAHHHDADHEGRAEHRPTAQPLLAGRVDVLVAQVEPEQHQGDRHQHERQQRDGDVRLERDLRAGEQEACGRPDEHACAPRAV